MIVFAEITLRIDAKTIEDADALAARIARETQIAYQFRADGGPDAVVATASVEAVAEKH